MDKPGKTLCVSPPLPTGRRLSTRLHSTVATSRIDFDSGRGETFSRLPAFSLFFPEPVQTTETTASHTNCFAGFCPHSVDWRNHEYCCADKQTEPDYGAKDQILWDDPTHGGYP
jgi:hypothetical protein